MTEPSVFTKIINREVPADIVFEDDAFIVIKSIKPVAPVHLLIIPKEPFTKLQDVPLEDIKFHATLLTLARTVAEKAGIGENFQLHINCGSQVQQVQHLHLHLTGGWEKNLTSTAIDRLTAEHLSE